MTALLASGAKVIDHFVVRVVPRGNELIEFLHEFFPERARDLASLIKRENAETPTLEAWLERLLVRFIEVLILNADELERAHREQRVSTLAWTARNILELSVWIDYCLKSDDDARRFRDDALRDISGWATAIQADCVGTEGQEDVVLARAQTRLADYAAREFGLAPLDDTFKRVSEAAREVGRYDSFMRENKVLSKFAHPTAWMVSSALETKLHDRVRDMFLSAGVEMATDALTRMRGVVVDRLQRPVSSNKPD